MWLSLNEVGIVLSSFIWPSFDCVGPSYCVALRPSFREIRRNMETRWRPWGSQSSCLLSVSFLFDVFFGCVEKCCRLKWRFRSDDLLSASMASKEQQERIAKTERKSNERWRFFFSLSLNISLCLSLLLLHHLFSLSLYPLRLVFRAQCLQWR